MYFFAFFGLNLDLIKNFEYEISDIENHAGFAKRLKSVLNENHNSEMIRNSIKSRFSKEIILENYKEVLKNVLN